MSKLLRVKYEQCSIAEAFRTSDCQRLWIFHEMCRTTEEGEEPGMHVRLDRGRTLKSASH